ncbi:PREDICTED: phosphatidylinositol 3,4,5-trisphosphate 5-phosphatase 2-like [Nanorana parkeri]|uniref:phosphatidylinositol 3,4,5-trisphosphate 5-phosphatase 2-like n=1 Tax=Nanorana parkeri TaxID=125878 RepID=UPI000853FC5E|nr:PREDICTED: phosphatidylinositol 3,4,5-trisphosphate 5-phosphatase 2-like [Nanorana parkeri]
MAAVRLNRANGTSTPPRPCAILGCTDDIMTSDHSPVFASFEVGVTSQFVSKKGLLKPSDQAYIEFESIEAIVKTASRTKFFIEFYSGCLEEYKKSSENDSQSIDNVNFLKVQWSSRQLPTLRPIVSEIEYLQDQHLLLTVKSMDGYESYGECVIALKSMIGSTTQQFLTYLSHRGEETGNIRGSMRVRVPAERMGTRERLYEWISIDKDETGAVRGKPPTVSRPNQEHSKSVSRKLTAAEPPGPALGKTFEEPEKGSAVSMCRPPAALPAPGKEDPALARCSQNELSQDNTLRARKDRLTGSLTSYYGAEDLPSTESSIQNNLISVEEPEQLYLRFSAVLCSAEAPPSDLNPR